MATPNELINELTADFLSSKGLEYVWEQACRKFFVKTGQVAGTEIMTPDDNLLALSAITTGETSSNHKLGLFRRTEGVPNNTWALDTTHYVFNASISADGITLDRINPDGTEEETDKPLISMSSIKTAIGLKSAAYLEANNTAGNIPLLDSNGHLSIGVIPDAILGQVLFGGTISGTEGDSYPVIGNTYLSTNAKTKIEKKTGKEIGTRKLQLVNVPQSQAGTWTTATAYVGYDACEGIYFIFSVTGPFTFAGEEYNVGDWIISTGSAWKKVDNTDAVTGIKFLKNGTYSTVDIGEVIVSCDKIGALDLFTTSKQTMLGDLEIGTSSSAKGLSAWGGVAAHGIGDLTSGGGGGGASGVNILRDWANYDGTDETQVLGTNLAKAMKDNVTSKGNATHPVYFNANGVAVAITSYAGNAATASALVTARNITIGNKTLSFDGSANISFSLAEIGAQAVIADVSDSVNGYVSKVTQTNGRIGVTHTSFTKPAITLSATKIKITTDGGASDEVTIPTWNQDTTGNAATATKVGHTLTFGSHSYDGSAAKTITLADLATLADGKYAISISGKADTAGTADKVEHALTIKKNSTTLYAFDGSAVRTLELDYSLTVNGTVEEPTGFTLAIDGTEIDLVALTETEIRNICN